jgi:hypothetical protein
MNWQLSVRLAETVLKSSRVIPSEEIIAIIKRVNPTRLPLSDAEREHGYQIKNRLQNLLLENYGAAFHLAPDPYLPDLFLIRHNILPSIDACHADLNALSPRALDAVSEGAAARPAPLPAGDLAKPAPAKTGSAKSAKESLKNAQLLLERYEYPEAEEILATLRISDADDLPVLVKAATVLVNVKGLSMFYNMETNKFSQKFCPRRVVHTETPSRRFYLESDMTKPVIFLKDITEEVESLLEWQVFLTAAESDDKAAAKRFMEQIENPECFSIVKPVNPSENSAAVS